MLNQGQINAFQVDGSGVLVIATGSGSLVSITQLVGFVASGALITFEQDVELLISGAGQMVSFEQNTKAISASAALITFEQYVWDASIPDHYTRTGWDAFVYINGSLIPPSQLTDVLKVRREENSAALAEVTLLPALGTQDIASLAGESIFINARTSDGVYRIFTGVIDIPEVDFIQKKIKLRCTDRRTEQINDQLGSVVETIGYFDTNVFKTSVDTAHEMEQRLSTIPYALDFDAFGDYTLTPWAAKATADYELASSTIYYTQPKVQYLSRGRITNTVNIGLDYRFARLHHMERTFSWTHPAYGNPCLVVGSRYTTTAKSMVEAAISAAHWPLSGTITYLPNLTGGYYMCGGIALGWTTAVDSGTVTQNFDNSGAVQTDSHGLPLTDSTGSVIRAQGAPVNDAHGNPTYTYNITSVVDTGYLYTLGATWSAYTQWAQTVTDGYSISVVAPQSVSQFGIISEAQTYSLESKYDTATWEQQSTPELVLGSSFVTDADEDRQSGALQNAATCVLNRARTTILAAHRDTRVIFQRFFWPIVDLKHTVKANTAELVAKGKVYTIEHTLSFLSGEAKTEITLALSKSSGSTSDTPLALPATPNSSVSYDTSVIYLDNHFGQDPSQASASTWSGMIGNRYIPGNTLGSTSQYPVQFRVVTPPIPDALRAELPRAASGTYDVAIPDDLLTITF